MSEPVLIRAMCGDHAIEVQQWDGDDEIWLAMWSPVEAKSWGRFHRAWSCLRGDWGFNNDCVLSRIDADRLIVALSRDQSRP